MKQDLRTVKTEQAIEQSFMNLIEEYDFKNITVQMICGKAQINRRTFYAHYADKYALAAKLLDKETEEYKYVLQKSLSMEKESAAPDEIFRFAHTTIRKVLPRMKLLRECQGKSFQDVIWDITGTRTNFTMDWLELDKNDASERYFFTMLSVGYFTHLSEENPVNQIEFCSLIHRISGTFLDKIAEMNNTQK